MKKISKQEIVETLLNQDMDIKSEEEVLDLLMREPIAVDVDKKDQENITLGDKVADQLTLIAGSWKFIIGFTVFLIIWIILNLFVFNLDPYPFILLNLLLSCLAALQAPIIMMSQNREANKDRMRSHNDYRTDLKSELILEELYDKMEKIIKNQQKLIKKLNDKNRD